MKAIIRKILWMVLLVCTLGTAVSCSSDSDDTPQEESGRVLLAYMVANNNLDANIINNVVWMYRGLARAKKSCTLLIYYKGRSYFTTPTILTFKTDGRGRINGQEALAESQQSVANVLAQAEQVPAVGGTAVDASVMKANLQKMQAMAPARSYGLIFASHATGWLPSSNTLGRSFGLDSFYTINIPEMTQALKESFSQHQVDFMIFDACMMGTAEVCYELRNVARYCVVSVMESPACGLPYDTFIDKLYDDNADLQYVCDQAVAYNKGHGLWGTYAVVDCEQMEQLAECTKEQLLPHRSEWKQMAYWDIQQYGLASNGYLYFSSDMAEMVKLLNGGVDAALPAAFRQALDKAVPYKTCVGKVENPSQTVKPWAEILEDESRYCGLGMYLAGQNINASWDTYLPSLAWYQAVGWKEFLSGE